MNFSKLSNVMLSENPVVELDTTQLSFIAGGCKGNKHHSENSSNSASSASSTTYVPLP